MQRFKTITYQYVVVVNCMARHRDKENNVVLIHKRYTDVHLLFVPSKMFFLSLQSGVRGPPILK